MSPKSKGPSTRPAADSGPRLSRAERRELRDYGERADWLLRESRRLLKRRGRKLSAAVREEVEGTRASLVSVCEPPPHERNIDSLQRAVNALDDSLARHLARYRKSATREYFEAIFWAVFLALLIRAFVFEAFRIPTGSMIPTLQVHDHLFVNKFIYGLKIPFTRIKFLEFRAPHRGEIIVFEYPYDDDPDSTGKDLIKRVVAVPGDRVRLQNNRLILNGDQVPAQQTQVFGGCGEGGQSVRACDNAPASWCVYAADGEGGERQVLGHFAARGDAQAQSLAMDGYACASYHECLGGIAFTSQIRVPVERGGLWRGQVNDPDWPPPRFEAGRFGPHARRYAPPENGDWPEFVVPEGHLLMMGDNRDNSKDGRFFGLVPYDAVKGKAGFVWFAYKDDFYRPNFDRIGTLVHQDPQAGEDCHP